MIFFSISCTRVIDSLICMEEDLVFGSFAPAELSSDGELAISILLRILKSQSPIYQSNLSNIEATMRTYSD